MEQLSLIPEAGLHKLKMLEDEDIYVDTATLIQKIANQCVS